MEQKNFRVSDAIPEMPASFDKRVENTLRAVCTEQNRRASRAFERRPVRFNKKVWIAIAVAATLLITTTAVAASAILNRAYTPENYMMQPSEERETIPDVENAIASAKPETADYEIIMLPEFENAKTLNEWRQKMGQPAYSEEDWGWIRDIRPEIEEVLLDGNSLVFKIKLNTDHGLSFSWDQSLPQMVDATSDDVYFTTEDGHVGEMPGIGTGIDPNYVTEDGATLYTECELSFLSEPFPTDGLVRITAEIGIRDVRVDDMGSMGLLAKMRCAFTIDASAGADVREPIVTERALAGTYTLTVMDKDCGLKNMAVSLDGVVLEETVSFRNTGIYVTYKVKSAPESWTEDMRRALLQPSSGSGSFGMSATYMPDCSKANANGEPQKPGLPNGLPLGEISWILPIFPSDYKQLRETGYGFTLSLCCVDTCNGEKAGDDWTAPDGTWNIRVREQPVISVMLPNP